MKPKVARHKGDAFDVVDPRRLSRDARLDRWAAALERRADEALFTLRGTEHEHGDALMRMRHDCSALAVAYDDPVLRLAGLRNDSYGEALRFFALSHRQLHRIVCHCHFGDTVPARQVAAIIRSIASDSTLRSLNAVAVAVATALLVGGTMALAALP